MIPPVSATSTLPHAAPTDKVHLLETKEDVAHAIKMAMFQKFFIEKNDDDPQKMPDKIDM